MFVHASSLIPEIVTRTLLDTGGHHLPQQHVHLHRQISSALLTRCSPRGRRKSKHARSKTNVHVRVSITESCARTPFDRASLKCGGTALSDVNNGHNRRTTCPCCSASAKHTPSSTSHELWTGCSSLRGCGAGPHLRRNPVSSRPSAVDLADAKPEPLVRVSIFCSSNHEMSLNVCQELRQFVCQDSVVLQKNRKQENVFFKPGAKPQNPRTPNPRTLKLETSNPTTREPPCHLLKNSSL